MCVKSRRLDVASTCLGNMGNARALQALRQLSDQEPFQKLAILAVQLGMPEEAEEIYTEKNMYRALSDLYQAQGLWDQAISIVEKNDRISLKSTYYKYGKFLERNRRFEEAVTAFEKAGTAK